MIVASADPVIFTAIIHYKPTEEDCAVIDKDQMYLCDSGGGYGHA